MGISRQPGHACDHQGRMFSACLWMVILPATRLVTRLPGCEQKAAGCSVKGFTAPKSLVNGFLYVRPDAEKHAHRDRKKVFFLFCFVLILLKNKTCFLPSRGKGFSFLLKELFSF